MKKVIRTKREFNAEIRNLIEKNNRKINFTCFFSLNRV